MVEGTQQETVSWGFRVSVGHGIICLPFLVFHNRNAFISGGLSPLNHPTIHPRTC